VTTVTRGARVFTWAGGAMFVASLAICAYHYLIVWARPVPHTVTSFVHDIYFVVAGREIPVVAIGTNLLLLTVFALHHSVFARESVKGWIAATIPAGLIRSVYVWIASVLLILLCVFWKPIAGELYDAHGARAILHAAVQLAGVWLIARAVATIDPLELAGIRPSSGDAALQVGGPYRLVRHPLYLGWLLATLGAAHMTGDRLTFAIMTAAYLFAAVPLEERSLVRSFGEDYARYQRQVRWRIVPFIY
jgi:methanethiol S-methyltransferase